MDTIGPAYYFKNETMQESCYVISALQCFIHCSDLFSPEGTELIKWEDKRPYNGNQSFLKLLKLLKEANAFAKADIKSSVSLKEFRKILSEDYNKSFPFKQGGDASSFLTYLYNNFKELQNFKEDLEDDYEGTQNQHKFDLDRVFTVNYLKTNVGNFSEYSIAPKHTKSFHINMELIVKVIENCLRKDVPLGSIFGKMVEFANVCLRTEPGMHRKNIREVLKSKYEIQFSEEYILMSPIPKYLCFELEFGKYFNPFDDMNTGFKFKHRESIARIMPEEFPLSQMFTKVNGNGNQSCASSFGSTSDILTTCKNMVNSQKCVLDCIITFYGGHYTAMIKKDVWRYYDDDKIVGKQTGDGSYSGLLDYMQNSRLIPYVVYYKILEDKSPQLKYGRFEEEKIEVNETIELATDHESFKTCYDQTHKSDEAHQALGTLECGQQGPLVKTHDKRTGGTIKVDIEDPNLQKSWPRTQNKNKRSISQPQNLATSVANYGSSCDFNKSFNNRKYTVINGMESEESKDPGRETIGSCDSSMSNYSKNDHFQKFEMEHKNLSASFHKLRSNTDVQRITPYESPRNLKLTKKGASNYEPSFRRKDSQDLSSSSKRKFSEVTCFKFCVMRPRSQI